MYRSKLKQELIFNAVDLDAIGVSELAWVYKDITQVIDEVTKMEYAILGGDVYSREDKDIYSTGDSWYLDNTNNLPWQDYVSATKQKALEYINAYHLRNGSNYLYTLVCSNKPSINL